VKQNMIYNQIPLDQDWKLLILHELLIIKILERFSKCKQEEEGRGGNCHEAILIIMKL